MEHKEIKIAIKEISDEGSFTGYAAIFGNVDLGGDIIERGAFAKTLKENPHFPVLWGHNTSEVIGLNQESSEDSIGLRVKGQLILDVQRAKEARSLMKLGAVRGLSIGYDALGVDYSRSNEGIRILKEVKLYEYSLVPFPMNPEAQVTGVKTFEDFETKLQELVGFAARQGGKLSANQSTLVQQAADTLTKLTGRATAEEIDLSRAAKECDAMLRELKQWNRPRA